MADIPKDKTVSILVPKGFQNRQLMKPTDPEHPEYGECLSCKGTGAEVKGVMLLEPEVIDGKIVKCKPALQLVKCKCAMGQFWVKFHPLNVQAKIIPKWSKEINEMKEQEKARILRELAGRNYTPGQDDFLSSLGYQKPDNKKKLLSVDDVLDDMFKKDGVY